ncbi:MAG: hypothetical protein ACREI8_04000, partial [Myxococcota bacterium]
MSEHAEHLLHLLFDAPGDSRAWWSFFDALGEAISPDVRVLMLVEVTHPVPSTALLGSGTQHVAAGLLPRRSDGKPRIEALPEGAVFELPRLGSSIA